MKVLLVHPPVVDNMPVAHSNESLGLGYLTAALRREGHEVELFDGQLRQLTVGETIREILTRNFDCLGITCMHEYKEFLIEAARAVRKARRDVIITAGGYLPTLNTKKLLLACPEIDFVVRGEGEVVAPEVLGRIDRGEEWRDTLGIGFRDGESVTMTPVPPLIQDLDTLPFPARDALGQAKSPELLTAAIASGRGCYHRCSFCCVNSFYEMAGGRAPRFRSAANTVDEVESVVSSTGLRKFSFVDEDFIGPGKKGQERATRIAEELKNRNLGIVFTIEARADTVDEGVLKLLREAGLSGVFLGIESGVQRQLDTYNKHITVEQNKRGIEMVRDLGFDLHPGFIMFDPYLTVDELQENVRFLNDTQLYKEQAPVSRIRLYEGVTLADKVREDGLLIDKGLDLEYKFQDPQIGLSWKVAQATSKWTKIKRRVRGALGGGKDE